MNENIVRLAGQHIDLCVFRTDDEAIKLYTTWINDESINMWVGGNDTCQSINGTKKWIDNTDYPENVRFNIVTKEGILIGNCNCGRRSGNSANTVGLGILIGEEIGRNNGYGTEVIKMLVKFAFNEMNAHRVTLNLVADNERALRCYTKAGFTQNGLAHDEVYFGGKYHDLISMEILRQNWKEE
jgi:RimJ/RimL family protein N-acetyltransferase